MQHIDALLPSTPPKCFDIISQFRERMVRKTYVAIVHGVLPAEEGEVDLPLCRNRGCPPLHMVNFEMGKPSLTEWYARACLATER